MLQLHAVGDGSKVLLLADTDPKFVCLVGGITSHGFWVLVHRDINIRWWVIFFRQVRRGGEWCGGAWAWY